MRGRPVWLASTSRQSPLRGGRLATSLWLPETMRDSKALLRRVLGPAGDPTRERIFRMQVTLCIHRAISDEELVQLPDWFHDAPPTDLAGGPVEILEETEDSGPSTRPCHAPERIPIDPRNPLLWIPGDCGSCPPCAARAEHDRRADATGVEPLYLSDLQIERLGGAHDGGA